MDISAHFDKESLDTLRDVMEEEFDDLFDLFLNDSDQRLALMLEAESTQDAEALCSQVHSLKGSSGNICAYRLSDLSKALEHDLRSDDLPGWPDISAQLRGIETEYQTVKNLIAQGLS